MELFYLVKTTKPSESKGADVLQQSHFNQNIN